MTVISFLYMWDLLPRKAYHRVGPIVKCRRLLQFTAKCRRLPLRVANCHQESSTHCSLARLCSTRTNFATMPYTQCTAQQLKFCTIHHCRNKYMRHYNPPNNVPRQNVTQKCSP
uniref:Uncharacterized protein n=1 Tax=Physcomitrium patens TaxID=3218 RepID=A0A2K1KHU0_PHYPA|nr:hypothetical protein PHYPA_007041 [Physcomitrium patens]